ncbi:hypothetical protein SAMN02910451_02913 [Butyrivibrio hungatei]|uniref:Uncharacterized protein n=1 Tax=Butyrivibrio hungatei TaxID=185008 RepID=A0A1G5GJP8_9FIRM|nr:hypothetical protein [Butyrivibrio hungatei]SCY51802.1 hypothetical protein SAMN02910451_02913 [Butyrivibrio hungatei]
MDNTIIAAITVSSALTLIVMGCGAKDNKLVEMESELVRNQGNAQICVYNDVFEAYGKKSNYTFIDIIKDNEVKETINTYRYLDKVTDIDCFDFSDDGIKDIALIGDSGDETKILLYESTSEYHYDVFSGWSDVGDVILGTLDEDFPMKRIEALLDKWSPGYTISDEVYGMFDADNWKYKAGDYKEAYAAIARLLGPEYEDAKYDLVDIDGKAPFEFVISSSRTNVVFYYEGGYAHRFLLYNLREFVGDEYEHAYSPGKSIIRNLVEGSDATYCKEYIPVLEGFEPGDSVAYYECNIKDFDGDGEITAEEWEMSSPDFYIAYETWYENWSDHEMSDNELKKLVDGYSSLDYEDLSGSLSFDEFIKKLENEEIEEKQEITEIDYSLYEEFVESLKTNMKEESLESLYDIVDKWDLGLSEGLSYYAKGDPNAKSMWYLQKDIDGDGVDELLLGTGDPDVKLDIWRGDDYICDLFTIRNRKLLHVFKGSCRNRYYICEDGTIENEFGSGSSMDKGFYRYSKGELQFLECISSYADYSDDNVGSRCYYANKDGNARKLTEKEYDVMGEELECKYNKQKLQFHPFKD